MQPAWFLLVALASAGYLSDVLDTLTSLIAQYGYPAVFAAAFLEVIFPPIPSEVVFPLVGFTAQSKGLGLENAIGMATVGALGSTAGAIVIYYLAKVLGRAAILRYGRNVRVGEQELLKAEKWFVRYGPVAVFTARMVPGIRELISIPAGISDMGIPKFAGYTFAGSLVWSITLTLVGFYLGKAWSQVADQLSAALTTVGVAILAAIALGGVIWYLRRRKKEQSRQSS